MLVGQSLARCPSEVVGDLGPIEAWRANPEANCAVRIYRPDIAEGAAARRFPGGNVWILDFEPFAAPTVGRLPGWPTASENALPPAFSFATREQAFAYARRHGWLTTELTPVLETAKDPDPVRRRNGERSAAPAIVSLSERRVTVPRFPRVFP